MHLKCVKHEQQRNPYDVFIVQTLKIKNSCSMSDEHSIDCYREQLEKSQRTCAELLTDNLRKDVTIQKLATELQLYNRPMLNISLQMERKMKLQENVQKPLKEIESSTKIV